MLVKCCFLEAITKYCGSGVGPIYIFTMCGFVEDAPPRVATIVTHERGNSGWLFTLKVYIELYHKIFSL